jgi:radical SAM superfamily enzyme YgiQ (UPF0313 family)
MRIAFIWPHANTVYQTLPLSLAVLRSTIKDQPHDVRLFNLPLEGWRADSPEFHDAIAAFQPDLIAVSAWAVSFRSAVAAVQAAKVRCPQAVTLCGGMYPTLNGDQAWAPGVFDYLMQGEAEHTFPQFVRHLAAGDREAMSSIPGIYYRTPDGTLVRNNRPALHDDLDICARVDWEFLQLERAFARGYMSTIMGPKRKVAMFASRGCEYACHFCAAPLLNGHALRHWSVEFLTREIRYLYDRYGVRRIYFMDDNGTQDRAFFKDLCRGIADLGLRDLSVELYRGIRLENLDEEMLHLMRRAGFDMATIAPESGSERVRKLMHKDMTDADIRRAAKMVRDAGLSLQAYFIIGYPGETAAERRESYRYIYDLGLDVFSLHKYMALPGTPTFLKLVKDGRIPRDHTDSSHLIGEELPNYNGDLPAEIDREILFAYIKFYARYPWKIVHLLRMASAGGLWRSLSGTARAGVKSMVGRGDPGMPVPAIRELM